jgi:RNA polymerase sigma-70 factor (ECF subfamily)
VLRFDTEKWYAEMNISSNGRNGDRKISSDEFEKILFANEREVITLAFKVLRDHHAAEDVAQEALVRLWNALKQSTIHEQYGGWLRTVTINLCRDRIRREGVFKDSDPLDSDACLLEAKHGSAETIELLSRVHESLTELSDQQRHTFELIVLAGLSYKEASEIMGIEPETIRSYWAVVREKLRLACM